MINDTDHADLDALDAAMCGELDILKAIICVDPSKVHMRDEDGYFPIHRASYNGHISTIEYLLDQGADINARTLDLWCPLHSAVNWEEAGSVRTLLSRGASVNLATLSGQTAAHIAAKSSSQNPGIKKEVVELLLSRDDVDLTLRNDLGETALDLARRYSEFNHLFEERSRRANAGKRKVSDSGSEDPGEDMTLEEVTPIDDMTSRKCVTAGDGVTSGKEVTAGEDVASDEPVTPHDGMTPREDVIPEKVTPDIVSPEDRVPESDIQLDLEEIKNVTCNMNNILIN